MGRWSVALLLLCVGCPHPVLISDLQLSDGGSSPQEVWRSQTLHLDAVIAVYEHEARKSHDKMMVMSVLAVAAGAGSGAVTGLVANANTPQSQRAGWAGLSISLATLGSMFALLPHAHQYPLKEAGYDDKARTLREELAALELRCDELVALDEDPYARGACIQDARELLNQALSFSPGSPCKPPTGRDLQRWVASRQTLETLP